MREDQLNPLAAVLILAALGLVAGIYYAPVGVSAAAGLVAYFALAIGATSAPAIGKAWRRRL